MFLSDAAGFQELPVCRLVTAMPAALVRYTLCKVILNINLVYTDLISYEGTVECFKIVEIGAYT